MTNLYAGFGKKVRSLRKARDLSQEEFADLIDMDARTVVAIESGKRNPTLNTVHKIARVLKVKSSELLPF